MQRIALLLAIWLFVVGCAGKSVEPTARDRETAQRIAVAGADVLAAQLDGKEGERVATLLSQAGGVLIVPGMGTVGLLLSVGGGSAMLFKRVDGQWRGPVFLGKTTGGWGLQAGFSITSGLVIYAAPEDVDYVNETGALLQANANVVLIDSDIELARTPEFFESGDAVFVGDVEGLYAGLAFSAGGFSNRTHLNAAFYGITQGDPDPILAGEVATPAAASRLLGLLERADGAAQAQGKPQ